MTTGGGFKIDLAEEFPHLRRAPIVEAVIHWRARSEKPLEPQELRRQLAEVLPDYPTINSQHALHVESAASPEGSTVSRRDEWIGFHVTSADGRNIAQFARNGFVFSRISPYEDWDRFSAEAKRLWQIYVDLARPSGIERLGVRFINRITPIDPSSLSEVLSLPPHAPNGLELPISEFLNRILFEVPGHPYRIHVIQTIQPPTPQETTENSAILDIDVFTTQTVEMDNIAIDRHLSHMRWLKNKAFYSLVTRDVQRRFEEPVR